MNTHQIWLKQLQDSVDKRRSQGHLTVGEINQKQFEVNKSIQEQEEIEEGLKKAVDAVQSGADLVSGALSFIPGGNLIGSAIDVASAGVDAAQGQWGDAAARAGTGLVGIIPGAGGVAKGGIAAAKGIKAVSKLRNVSKMGARVGLAASYDPEGDALMEEIANEMIEEFEQLLGRRLLPEEIEEFVENNYESIQEKANQVTANAHPGDKSTGVGATKPVEPMKTEGGSLKAKAAKFNPKSVGSDGY